MYNPHEKALIKEMFIQSLNVKLAEPRQMATPNYNINENIKKLLEEVAKKNGVTYNQVKDLYVARFRFIKEAMESC